MSVSSTQASGALSGPAAVQVQSLTVRYGPLTALSDFDFAAPAGRVTAVIGPNGSGKSTFVNALTGAVSYQAGQVRINGVDVSHSRPGQLHALGISRTFQNLDLMDDLTVQDNVRLGASSSTHATLLEAAFSAPRSLNESRQRKRGANAAMELLGISEHSRQLVSSLAYGVRRRVEVARALASKPTVLLLDEPTAGMGPNESAEFSELIKHLRDELGLAVVLIEHDMSVVRSVADYAYALSAGVLIGQGVPATLLEDPEIKRIYLGSFESATA